MLNTYKYLVLGVNVTSDAPLSLDDLLRLRTRVATIRMSIESLCLPIEDHELFYSHGKFSYSMFGRRIYEEF
jgi:hypothetical protein